MTILSGLIFLLLVYPLQLVFMIPFGLLFALAEDTGRVGLAVTTAGVGLVISWLSAIWLAATLAF